MKGLLVCFTLISLVSLMVSSELSLPPSSDCSNEIAGTKYYNEPCTIDGDCFGPSVKCQEGKCTCVDNYVPGEKFLGEEGKQIFCVPAPHLNSECSAICQKPLVCKLHTQLNRNVCLCEPPFKLSGYLCDLECKDNEEYDSKKYRCIPKCEADEIKVDDTCLKRSQIGEVCQVKKQCWSALSECKNGHCSCLEGFSVQDGLCILDEFQCPYGQIVKSPKRCTFAQPVDGSLTDNCTSDHFCHTLEGLHRHQNHEGICCPGKGSFCPVGKPHPTAHCRGAPSFVGRDCPWDTHTCIETIKSGYHECCPTACRKDTVFIDGKCYPAAKLNHACLLDKQCTDSKTYCVDGYCRCLAHATEVKVSSRPSYCTINCPDGHILHDGKCFKQLSLGDSCLNESWRCLSDSICNKFKVCACSGSKFTLSKDLCSSLPKCPAPNMHHGRCGTDDNAHWTREYSKCYMPMSDEKRKNILKNVTFCSIPGKKSPKIDEAKNVELCPNGQYCASFVNNLGICCNIPDFVCPHGKKPASLEPCHKGLPLSCSSNQYCHDYLNTADSNSTVGNFCCEHDHPVTIGYF